METSQIGIRLTFGKIIRTVFYADDRIILADSKDELQTAANELKKSVK
jgi:hypothetical protein